MEIQRSQIEERHILAAAPSISEVLEEERSRIARELHDDTGQGLAALLLGLMALLEHLSDPTERERVGELIFSTSSIIEGVRRMLRGLRPLSLEKEGLSAALGVLTRDFASRSGIEIDLQVFLPPGARYTEAVEITLFRFIQEALSNVLRHAAATRVSVLLAASDGELRALVEDDGSGFPAGRNTSPESLGLIGLRERVQALAGRVEIQSVPGRTTVHVTLPEHGPS